MNKILKFIKKNKSPYLFMLIVFCFSFFVAKQTQTIFPHIKIESKFDEWDKTQFTYINETSSMHSPLHDKYCSNKFNDSIMFTITFSIDPRSVHEGDLLLARTQETGVIDFNHIQMFTGLYPDKLKEVHHGSTSIDSFYYENINNTWYMLWCLNVNDGDFNESSTIQPIFQRPSFLDNWIIFWISTITLFIVLWQFITIILKPFLEL